MAGFVFDLDGTLINSLDDIANSMNRALAFYGLKAHPVVAYKQFVGNGAKKLAQRAAGAHEDWERVYEYYMEDYKKNSLILTAPYPGIVETLQEIEKKKIPMAIFSNKPHRDTIKLAEHFFPEVSFVAIRGQMEEVPVKPDPCGALLAAEEMNLSPENIFYIGDSGVDMVCASRAGMTPVGVTWGFREKEELIKNGAETIVSRPFELLDLLKDKVK